MALFLALPALGIGGYAALQRDPVLGACAVYAVALALLLRRPGELNAIAREAADRDRAFAQERAEFQGRIDVLSAQREISLILNEDVDFKTILEKVLAIVADTLGADDIEIHAWGDKEKLVPRAARVGGRTVFGTAVRGADPLLLACVEHGNAVMTAAEGRLEVRSPLSADREIIGVVKFTTTPERGERAVRQLAEMSKFIASALKTPDLYTRATQDGLTGLGTKRHFLTELDAEVAAARRNQEPLTLIMLDIDHFKRVNDTHGHPAGDKVLKGVAGILRKKVRRSDGNSFRYGGEEMIVLLPRTDLAMAMGVAERLRAAVEEKKFTIDRRKSLHVTASFGVARFDLGMKDGAALVEKADEALYRAKRGGRNRVITAGRSSPVRAGVS